MCFKFWRAPRVTVLRRALCGALARCAVVPNPGCAPAPSLQPGNAMAGARAGAGSRAQRAAAAEAREKVEALCDADGGGVFGDMILGLLDDPADLQRAMSVSKKWRGFAGHDLAWQRFCQPYPMLQLLQTRTGELQDALLPAEAGRTSVLRGDRPNPVTDRLHAGARGVRSRWRTRADEA